MDGVGTHRRRALAGPALSLRARARQLGRSAITLALGATVAMAMVAMHVGGDTVATLEVIGFSPDRSRLLAALVLELGVVGAATLVTGAIGSASVAGMIVFAASFRRTFLQETTGAMQSSGPLGAFDPAGWAISLLTLAVTAAVVAGIVGIVSLVVRRQLIGTVADLRRLRRGPGTLARLRRPGTVAIVVATLFITLPVLGDMLNYEPDVHMRVTAAGSPGTVNDVAGTGEQVGGGATAAGGSPPTSGTATLSSVRPWLAWRPQGIGSTTTLRLPAPWGTAGTSVAVTVYLPPGYGATSARYPVLYETPWSAGAWFKGANLAVQLDSLADAGAIPATIVVFLAQGNGPYPDSECINSADGREWYDRWVVETVVPQIDQAFRTIASPVGRGLFGYSHGGFCAAMLALRHSDVFGSAIAFSGYYQAGLVTSQTTNAGLPFGGSQQLKTSYSPLALAGQVPPDARGRMLLELSASPHESFYGPQYALFVRALRAAGIPMELLPTALGHSWAAVRSQFAQVVETWAEHLAAQHLWA